MAAFLDSSVLLDLVLPKRPRFAAAARVVAKSPELTISALSVHLAAHFGKKESMSVQEIFELLEGLRIVPLDETAINWARRNPTDNDFEDTLQVACAVLNSCNKFVTADTKLAKNYSRFIDIQLLD